MEEVPTGWQPDPFGVHEMRFISSDGLPTKLVSDGNTRSYDDPPGGAPSQLVTAPVQPVQPSGPVQPSWPSQRSTPAPYAAPEQPSWPSQQPTPVHAPPLVNEPPTRSNISPLQAPRENGQIGQNGHGQVFPQGARLALLCGNCGQRHNAPDGMCPQCGEGPRLTGSHSAPPNPTAPAPPPAVTGSVPAMTAPAPAMEQHAVSYLSPGIEAPFSQPMVDHRPPPTAFAPPPLQPPLAMQVSPQFAPPQSVNPFAIASLVLSLVAVPIAGSILAIVFGVMAKRQIRETPGGQGGRQMASWGIALGCVGLVGAIIVAFVLALSGGSSNALSPGASTTVGVAFGSASRPLDTANANLTRAIAAGDDSVAQIAQAVTPYVTALTTFDYKIRRISWTPAEQLQSERLEIQAQDVIRYASTISTATAATSATWLTHLRTLGAAAQSSDNALRETVGVAKVSDFP